MNVDFYEIDFSNILVLDNLGTATFPFGGYHIMPKYDSFERDVIFSTESGSYNLKKKEDGDTVLVEMRKWSSFEKFKDVLLRALLNTGTSKSELKEYRNVIIDIKSLTEDIHLMAINNNYGLCFVDMPDEFKNKYIVTADPELTGCISSRFDGEKEPGDWVEYGFFFFTDSVEVRDISSVA